jgi:hypothetical protein
MKTNKVSQKVWIQHSVTEGSRLHVVSYGMTNNKAWRKCSCKDCEVNRFNEEEK